MSGTESSLRRALRHLSLGLFRYGFPPCCVLRFAVDEFGTRPPAMARGIRFRRGDTRRYFVPCGVIHAATLTASEWFDLPRHWLLPAR